MPIHKTLNHNFFKTWSPDMAYVLGYFAADGSMIRNSRKAHFIEFTSIDRTLIRNLQKIINSNHTVTQRRRDENWSTAYRLQIGSKSWFEDLSTIGFTPAKSLTLAFPSIPRFCFGDFVRGYFDGDGCVYFKKLKYADRQRARWTLLTLFTCGSRKFLTSLCTRLREYGVSGGYLGKKRKGGFHLTLSHRDSLALYRLMYHTGRISYPFLPRKRAKLERAIKVLGLT